MPVIVVVVGGGGGFLGGGVNRGLCGEWIVYCICRCIVYCICRCVCVCVYKTHHAHYHHHQPPPQSITHTFMLACMGTVVGISSAALGSRRYCVICTTSGRRRMLTTPHVRPTAHACSEGRSVREHTGPSMYPAGSVARVRVKVMSRGLCM